MKAKSLLCIFITLLAAIVAGFAQTGKIETSAQSVSPARFARLAVSDDAVKSEDAIKVLRGMGQAGLDALFDLQTEFERYHVQPPTVKQQATRLRAALDAVGQQRDCYASHLFWFTDLDQAKDASRSSGKPILSLRLLGKLNEEYSCANSRFFRTTLYSNEEVSKYLRDHFVLHWQSVRPVPRITIDMGDGRKIERTITGNSIHYVLDSTGRPIDALPGLYGPKAFLAGLGRALDAAESFEKHPESDRENFLREYHLNRLAELGGQAKRDLATIQAEPQFISASLAQTKAPPATPDAFSAGVRAGSKMAVERPLLRAAQRSQLEAMNDEKWKAIAALHADNARLDASSRALIQSKSPTAASAAPLTFSKAFVETPMMRVIQNLERSISEDTVRNEYLMHSQIHEWFANGTAPRDLNSLNAKIYAQLFLTPDSDPWLGLAPADVFSALDNGGLVQNSVKR